VRIGLLGSKGTTLDLLDSLAGEGRWRPSALVTLPDRLAAKSRVAFAEGPELRARAAAHGVPCYEVATYGLTDSQDQELFRRLKLDVLLVIGWERLVPAPVLTAIGAACLGMHGSAFGLPRGRGRSPMNWAILTGQRQFVTSLFRYTQGIDDGDVLGSRAFEIGARDTIGTLHLKNRIAMLDLVRTYLPGLADGSARFAPQPSEPPTYYPRRTPEDGGIDWSWPTVTVDRLVRAVAPPYPGAFTAFDGHRIIVEDGQPFDAALFRSDIESGTVLDRSRSLGSFVVKTGDGSFLVSRAAGPTLDRLRVGSVLDSGATSWTRELLAARYGPTIPEEQWEIRPE
jgi:methionyl-tRNA formyltransferase